MVIETNAQILADFVLSLRMDRGRQIAGFDLPIGRRETMVINPSMCNLGCNQCESVTTAMVNAVLVNASVNAKNKALISDISNSPDVLIWFYLRVSVRFLYAPAVRSIR